MNKEELSKKLSEISELLLKENTTYKKTEVIISKEELLIKMETWLEELKHQEKAKKTLLSYKTNVLKFINWLPEGKKPINKNTTMAYKDYLLGLEPRPATRSINTWIIALNKFLKWLNLHDLTILKIKQQSKTSNEEVLTQADYKRMLRFAKKLEYYDIYYLMKVLAMTGIRIGEIRYFTVENIESNYIKVYNKGKERSIILRQDLARELRKYCRESNIKSGFIFTQTKDKTKLIDFSTAWRKMKKIAGAARVNKNKVHAHSFRHFFAQVFLDRFPDNTLDLADILGHNDLKTTREYTKTSNDQKRTKLEKMQF